MIPETPAIKAHKLKRPVRPDVLKCSAQEWAAYDSAVARWHRELGILEVDAVKGEVMEKVRTANTFNETFSENARPI